MFSRAAVPRHAPPVYEISANINNHVRQLMNLVYLDKVHSHILSASKEIVLPRDSWVPPPGQHANELCNGALRRLRQASPYLRRSLAVSAPGAATVPGALFAHIVSFMLLGRAMPRNATSRNVTRSGTVVEGRA